MYKTSTQEAYKALSSKELALVVGAISEGQYSLACFLLLKFSGYNPLQYIPYRTYNRLAKKVVEGAEFTEDKH